MCADRRLWKSSGSDIKRIGRIATKKQEQTISLKEWYCFSLVFSGVMTLALYKLEPIKLAHLFLWTSFRQPCKHTSFFCPEYVCSDAERAMKKQLKLSNVYPVPPLIKTFTSWLSWGEQPTPLWGLHRDTGAGNAMKIRASINCYRQRDTRTCRRWFAFGL